MKGSSEGQQRGQHHARGRQVKDGHPALSRGTGLFPPGPSDSAAWSDTPQLRRSGARQASLIASHGRAVWRRLDEPGESAPIPHRGLADGLASRSRALRLLGNGVVPLAAGYAWRALAAAHGPGAWTGRRSEDGRCSVIFSRRWTHDGRPVGHMGTGAGGGMTDHPRIKTRQPSALRSPP